MSFPDEDFDDNEQLDEEIETDDDDSGDGETGLDAMVRALGGDPDEEEEKPVAKAKPKAKDDEDDEEEEDEDEDEDDEKPAPKKPEPGKDKGKRTLSDALKDKRRQNKALRTEAAQLRQRLTELEQRGSQSQTPAEVAQAAELLKLAKERPYLFLKQAGADTSKLHEEMTQDALKAGGLSPQVREVLEGQATVIDELKAKLKQIEERDLARQQQQEVQAAIEGFRKVTSDLATYPEFEGYSFNELVNGAAQIVEQMGTKGIKSAPPEVVAKKLHAALAREHERIAARKAAKGKPKTSTTPPAEVDLPRVKSKKKAGKLPSDETILRRMTSAMNRAGLIFPC